LIYGANRSPKAERFREDLMVWESRP